MNPTTGLIDMRHLLGTLSLLAALALPAGAMAAAALVHEHAVTASAELDLREVFLAALTRDPRQGLPEAQRREAASLSDRADNLLAAPPALAVRHQTDQVGSNRGMREWEANLELPLWRWGQRQASRDLANAVSGFADAHGQALELEVAAAVRGTLWSLALAEERRAQAEQAWRAAQALEQDVRRRVEAGDMAQADLLLVRDETLAKQDEYLLAAAEVKHEEKGYILLTGLTQRPTRLDETQSSRAVIHEEHPLLLEAQRRMERAQAELMLAQNASADAPQLVVGTRRDKEAVTGVTQESIGVGIRLPLASGSYTGPAIAAANSRLIEAQGEQLSLRRRLELALHEAEHTLETLRAELELAQEQHQLAQENLRMARIAFDLGEIDLVQRLRIQTRAHTAERTLALRRLQQQQAIARYNQAVGELP